MENKRNDSHEELNENKAVQNKEKYISPEMKFVPIKVEERLMACDKTNMECAGQVIHSS